MSGKRWLAYALWELITTLRVTLPEGRIIVTEPEGWFEVVKFLYAQVDGPPKQQIGVDFTNMTDAQLKRFIDDCLTALGGSFDGSQAPESSPRDEPGGGSIPILHPPG